MLEQVVSLLGAAMILIAYAANQMGKLHAHNIYYLILNVVGSIILGIIAFRTRQAGLTLMEGAWALIALIGLYKNIFGSRKSGSLKG
jgi:hypothetical protein